MPSRVLRVILNCVVLCALSALYGCGGGGNNPDPPSPPAISVAVSPSTVIAQSGTTISFSSTVRNATDQRVAWSVEDIVGGNASVGTITAEGVYTAPLQILKTVDVRVTATAQVDVTRSASAVVTTFAAPRIGVRVVGGQGEFVDRQSGDTFVPRGYNYIRLRQHLILPFNEVALFHGTFGQNLYDPEQTEVALQEMEASGYNMVRVFLDPAGDSDGLARANAIGVSSTYLATVADFLTRAKAHHIYVMPTLDDIPKGGGYPQSIDPSCYDKWPACWFLEYTTANGVGAESRFWQDFVRGLVAQHAPMDAIFAYELRNEWYIPPDESPLDQSSGTVTLVNGKTYDMADPAAKLQLQSDILLYWSDRARTAIQEIAPGAMTTVGFFTWNDPRKIAPFPTMSASTMDFVDVHPSAEPASPLSQTVADWHMPVPSSKPVMMGEFAITQAVYPSITDAAARFRAFQAESCQYGFKGWLLWSWDTFEQTDFVHWAGKSANGEIRDALSPLIHSDPCVP